MMLGEREITIQNWVRGFKGQGHHQNSNCHCDRLSAGQEVKLSTCPVAFIMIYDNFHWQNGHVTWWKRWDKNQRNCVFAVAIDVKEQDYATKLLSRVCINYIVFCSSCVDFYWQNGSAILYCICRNRSGRAGFDRGCIVDTVRVDQG